jgi:hypothetical protein
MLHGESEYTFPPRPDPDRAQLHVEVRLESLTEKTGSRGGQMQLATSFTAFTDACHEVVATLRGTVIRSGDKA